MPNDEILAREAAEMAGIAVDTFYSYVNHRDPVTGEPMPTAPAAVRQVGRIKFWNRAEVEQWIATRPGRGGLVPGRVRRPRGSRVAPPKDEG
jgi:predicted DNA-binding transcriptional regulator AlpA